MRGWLSIDLSVEDSQKYYEARVVNNGVSRTMTCDADGNVTSQEIDASEAPEAVRKAMQQKQPGVRLLKLEKAFDKRRGKL